MKKIAILAAGALLVGMSSCDNAGNSKSEFFSAEATDSLTSAFAQSVGYNLAGQFENAQRQNPSLNKELLLKGIQYAMAADTAESYLIGINIGLNLSRQLDEFQKMGLDINRSKILNEFKHAFLADSLPGNDVMAALNEMNRKWTDSLQTAKREYDKRQLEESEEAIANTQKGEAFIAAAKAKNDSVKVADSGLAYKIESEGEGAKVNPEGLATVSYTAKTADGQVVDRRVNMQMRVSTVPDGLKEGLSLLGKGGKATLYVPGKLAYGVQVPPRYNIGLNELLIYDVEVVDVPTPEQ